MINLVTVSRQYGSGGGALARRLGALLDWPVFDEDLIHLVADRLRLDDETVREMDEVPPSLAARMIATILLIRPPELVHPIDTDSLLSPDVVARAVQAVLRDLVAVPPLIIVGHGSQCLFQRQPDALHLRTVAPLPARVASLSKRIPSTTPEELAAVALRMDGARAAYVRRYYGVDWQDPLLYALQINTSQIDITDAAVALAGLIKGAGDGNIGGAH